jgi:DNA polymerase elongation subunit (family B)
MRIAVLDLETDPFSAGQMIHPFVAGYYDGSKFILIWSPDCVKKLCSDLRSEEPSIVYAHNGGRFDFYYFLPYLDTSEVRIINGRIVSASVSGHELRDSFSIMPFPLATYDKDSINYELMRADRREDHKDEILKYLRKDLTSLYELCVAFHGEFGDKLTIGSASMSELKKKHTFSTGGAEYDAKFRKDFYFGGRNQVFKPGITRGDIRVYDVNSMYPHTMDAYLHPVGVRHDVDRVTTNDTCFVVAEGRNYGAFPTRLANGSLDFTIETGRFCCTIHEWRVALETGSFKPTKILKTYGWKDRASFHDFVDFFYSSRQTAKAAGDKIRTIFYKFILNSAYGKFAQNPENYFDWFLTKYGSVPKEWHECTTSCQNPCLKLWSMAYVHEGEYIIWQRPLQCSRYYNVATGASITGGARSILLAGICATPHPLYCDTDSIISLGPAGVDIDEDRLGAWKLEGVGTCVAIAGKKMYAVWDEMRPWVRNADEIDGPVCCLKKAHKGVRLTDRQILHIAKGGSVEVANPVPCFRWDGSVSFTTRVAKATCNVV